MEFAKQELDGLIRKYYAGNTSLKEERRLEDYFCTAGNGFEYPTEQAQFIYFRKKRHYLLGSSGL